MEEGFFLSCTWYREVALLIWDFGAWCKLSLWALAFGCSGPLALLPSWMGALVGPGDTWPIRGLGAAEAGSPLLGAGSHTGTHASLGSSIWDTMVQYSTAHVFWTATWRLRTVCPRP